MAGDHLRWVQQRANILLVVGQNAFEVHPPTVLLGAQRMAAILADKGIPHQFDLWSHDSAHDWPWWR